MVVSTITASDGAQATRAAAWLAIRSARPATSGEHGTLASLEAGLRTLATVLRTGDAVTVPAGPGGVAAALLAALAPGVQVTGIVATDPLSDACIAYWLAGRDTPPNLAFRTAAPAEPVTPLPDGQGEPASVRARPGDRLLFEPARYPGADWQVPILSDTARGVAYWAERGMDLSEIARRMDLPDAHVLAGADMLVAGGFAIAAAVSGGIARWHGFATRGHAYPDPAEWTLPAMWAMSCAAFADLPLIAEPDRPDRSYAECDAAMRAAAAFLHASGLRKGDLVILWTGQCAEFLTHLWACWHLGLVVLPAPVIAGPVDVARLAIQSGASAVLVRPGTDASAFTGRVLHVRPFEASDPACPVDLPLVAISPDDPAFVLPTSGTTRESRLAVHSHRSGISAGPVLAASITATGSDCITAPMGVSDMGGLRNCMIHTVWAGGAWLIMPDLEPGHVFRVARCLAINRATVLVTYPLLLGLLANLAAEGQVELPTSLRVIYTGGTTVEANDRRRYARVFGTEVVVGFGMTELSPAVHVRTTADMDEGDGVGRTFDCLTSIRDKSGETLPDGAEGTLWLLSERMMSGYLREGGLDRSTIAGGWLRNGDWMRREANGMHWHGGRDDPWIKLQNGLKVHLSTLSDALNAHSGVVEAVVVACRDDHNRESMAAFVAVRDAATSVDALKRYIRSGIGADLLPACLVLVDTIPRNARDKISLVDLYRLIPPPWKPR